MPRSRTRRKPSPRRRRGKYGLPYVPAPVPPAADAPVPPARQAGMTTLAVLGLLALGLWIGAGWVLATRVHSHHSSALQVVQLVSMLATICTGLLLFNWPGRREIRGRVVGWRGWICEALLAVQGLVVLAHGLLAGWPVPLHVVKSPDAGNTFPVVTGVLCTASLLWRAVASLVRRRRQP